jgi:hypothetical protein
LFWWGGVAELLPDEVLPPRRRHPEPELGFSPPADSLALDIWNDRKFHYLLYRMICLVHWTLSLIYFPNLIRELGLATPCSLAHTFVCMYVCTDKDLSLFSLQGWRMVLSSLDSHPLLLETLDNMIFFLCERGFSSQHNCDIRRLTSLHLFNSHRIFQ